MQIDLKELLSIAREAGAAILEIYNDPEKANAVTYKSDHSPLTRADEAAHAVISSGFPYFIFGRGEDVVNTIFQVLIKIVF